MSEPVTPTTTLTAVDPPPAAPSPEAPVDITDEMRARGALVGPDENPEDLVFAWDGERVKVKTFADPAVPMGFEVFRITGSIVGGDGKALRRSDGSPAVFGAPFVLTWQTDNPTASLDEALAAARVKVVQQTVMAYRNAQKGRSLKGVGVKPVVLTVTDPAPKA